MKVFTTNFLITSLMFFFLRDVPAQTRTMNSNGISIKRNLSMPARPLSPNNRPGQITGTPVPFVEWQKCLGSNYGEYANSIQATADGGYIVAGYTVGADNGDVMGHHGNATVGDIWIVKLDKLGNIEWQKSLGGMDSEQGACILPTPDGGYIVVGGAASRDCGFTGFHGGFDYYVAKLSGTGDIVWQKLFGGSKEDIATSVALSPDGGYFYS